MSSPVSASAGGFYVLILDSGTLARITDGTFPIPSGLGAMNFLLSQYILNTHALIFTQSIGSVSRPDSPAAAAAAWNLVAQDEQNIGGNRFLFDALPTAGHGDYALVTPAGNGSNPCCISPWADVESFAAARSAGRVSGVLARNPLSQYYPAHAGSHPGMSNSLPAVAYQPPAAGPFACPDRSAGAGAGAGGPGGSTPVWPCHDTAGHRAAITCVAAFLGLPEPIERNYWAAGNIDWSDEFTALDKMSYSSLPQNASCGKIGTSKKRRFTASDFGDVQTQLGLEFLDVDRVLTGPQSLIRNLQAPLTATQGTTYADLEQIASQISSAVQPPQAGFTVNPLEVISTLLGVGAQFVEPELGAALSLYAVGQRDR